MLQFCDMAQKAACTMVIWTGAIALVGGNRPCHHACLMFHCIWGGGGMREQAISFDLFAKYFEVEVPYIYMS